MPPSPRRRRKSKPSFEIPVGAGSPAEPVGWVYRAEEPVGQGPAVIPITSAAAAERLAAPVERPAPVAATKPAAMPFAPTPSGLKEPVVSARPYHPALVAAAGVFYMGAGSVALASLAALAVIGKPFKIAKGLFGVE